MVDTHYPIAIGLMTGLISSPIALVAPLIAAPVPTQTPAAIAQGTQIIVNGQSLAAAWQQWQDATGTHIGISDTAALETIGLQLLDSDAPSQQAVQWFTAPNLPTRLTATLRYVDITELARSAGWQLTIAQATLQIVTPTTRITGIRQSQQPWGDRLVIELDQPVPWQTNSLPQEIQLTLAAGIDPALMQPFKSVTGKFLTAVQLESVGTQTRLRIGFTAAARVWSLSAPNRIVVDIRPDALIDRTIAWAPGLRWRQQIIPLKNTRIPTVWLEVNPTQPGISLQPILPNPNTLMGTAPLRQTAQQAPVAAAINGGFFHRDRQLPLGAIRRNGQWRSGPILQRGAIAWDTTGKVLFGRLSLQETITTATGQRLALTHLNSGYLQAGIARYTSDWGATYTPLADGEIIISVENNQITGQHAIAKAGTVPVAIPSNGYLLVLRSHRSAAEFFTSGSILQLASRFDPPAFLAYPQILGAGPLLLQNQQLVLDAQGESFSQAFAGEAAARSAIAQRADGTLLLVTAHAGIDGTRLTLADMAHLLQQMGAIHALNLDGGSSTTLVLGGTILDR